MNKHVLPLPLSIGTGPRSTEAWTGSIQCSLHDTTRGRSFTIWCCQHFPTDWIIRTVCLRCRFYICKCNRRTHIIFIFLFRMNFHTLNFTESEIKNIFFNFFYLKNISVKSIICTILHQVLIQFSLIDTLTRSKQSLQVLTVCAKNILTN
jgi:hypothetical protein